MWCTRWFVPLLVLPIPSASPFFLLVLLVSLTVHARPCFYCIVLLTALFLSSCHWSPVPLSAPLSYPFPPQWGNATTFGEALEYSVLAPQLPEDRKPSTIRLIDRCWCDPALSRLFEPFDVRQWELASIRRTAREIRASIDSPQNVTNATASTVRTNVDSSLTSLFSTLTRKAPAVRDEGLTGAEDVVVSDAAAPTSVVVIPTSPEVGPPVLEYDLRSYGFPVVLDFALWRRSSDVR